MTETRGVLRLVGARALCGFTIEHLDDVLVAIFDGQVHGPVAPRVLDVRVGAVLQQQPHGVREAFVRGVMQQGAAAGWVDHVWVGAPLEEEEDQARIPHLNDLDTR